MSDTHAEKHDDHGHDDHAVHDDHGAHGSHAAHGNTLEQIAESLKVEPIKHQQAMEEKGYGAVMFLKAADKFREQYKVKIGDHEALGKVMEEHDYQLKEEDSYSLVMDVAMNALKYDKDSESHYNDIIKMKGQIKAEHDPTKKALLEGKLKFWENAAASSVGISVPSYLKTLKEKGAKQEVFASLAKSQLEKIAENVQSSLIAGVKEDDVDKYIDTKIRSKYHDLLPIKNIKDTFPADLRKTLAIRYASATTQFEHDQLRKQYGVLFSAKKDYSEEAKPAH